MSAVPKWKQAILERKKKQEDEEKKKQEEEDAYLSSLPPWKRAMVLRQKEKSGGVAPPKRSEESSKPVEKNDSFTKTSVTASSTAGQWPKAATAKPSWQKRTSESKPSQNEPPKAPWQKQAETKPIRGGSTPALRATSPDKPTNPPWPTHGSASKSADTGSGASVKPRRGSITVLPETYSSPLGVTPTTTTGGISLRKVASERRASVTEKRRSFEGSDTVVEEDAKYAGMPAWKKAILMRRRESKDQLPVPKASVIEEAPESPAVDRKQVEPTSLPVPVEPVVETLGLEETDSPDFPGESSQPQSVSVKQKAAPKQSETASTQRKKAPRKPAPKAPNKKTSKSQNKPAPLTTRTAEPAQKQLVKTANKKKTQPNTAKRPQPEIVNRTLNEPQKLVEQEGVTLLPPVYKEVDEWANVSEADPKFSTLPTWKQALIRRRRNDIAKRTGTSESEPSSEVPQNKSNTSSGKPTKAKKSKKGSYTVNTSPPSSPTLRPAAQSVVSIPASPPSRRAATYVVNPSPPGSPKKQSTLVTSSRRSSPPSSPTDKESFSLPSSGDNVPLWKKQLLERKSQGLSSSEQQEKRLMQTSGSGNKNVQSKTGGSVKAMLNRFNQGRSFDSVASQHPMPSNTWGGSKSTAAAMVNHNQVELSAGESSDEDIPFTNIDEVSSDDDDDSGIVKGGTVLLSFKPISNSPQLSNSNALSASHLPGSVNMGRRSSILAVTNEGDRVPKRRELRRVSFSDSQLTVEHVYPKYNYDDYVEDDGHDKDKTDGPSNNSGLSQRLHPSLRSPHDTSTDPYNLSGYTSPSPTKPSEKKIGLYSPSILSSFGDIVQPNFSDNSSPSRSVASLPPKLAAVEESPSPSPTTTHDYYSNLNQDTAALLW